MPVLPASLVEPLGVQCSAVLPERLQVAPTHPLGCHRQRIADRLVFAHVIAALVQGSGSERIASTGWSDRTMRRRLQDWAAWGLAEPVPGLALAASERLSGLDLEDLAVDGCITNAPSGGEVAGRSPVDQGNQLGRAGDLARQGVPAPRQAGSRWTVERTPRWMNGSGKLRRCTEQGQVVVAVSLVLGAALVVLRRLLQEARLGSRWPTRPRTRRLT